MKQYALGIDYGTLSARALLVELDSGAEVADAVFNYPHAVMDTTFLDGTALPADFALQHPQDYIEALTHVIPEVMQKASVKAEQIQSIGFDFTSCTILPVFKDGTPLCYDKTFCDNPHAYVKLWKHHAAQPYADAINKLAKESKWIGRYGGKVSSEWLLPKIMEILEKAPEVFKKTERFVEAGDWIIWQLTGRETHNISMAGFKGLWHSDDGHLGNEFLVELHPELDGLLGTKVAKEMIPMHSLAGYVTKEMAEKLGLNEGTPVAACNIDAHSSVPAAGITASGELLMIMGTSTCHIFMSETEELLNGICGVVKNGVLDGYYAYEAGQACVGDSFDWFVKNIVPAKYHEEAAERNLSVFALLDEKAAGLKPGESGLLALDWWNGNRST
ncbi:MAG: ribulokinase, partial [Clostridia bacterium]|nr:ribulokinase [Clostridia bacterium]